eukprot:gb/GECG01002926.1/.p1 GENE.gb/GECG01002926.1/~~gb/GECG01002926.1/.p1  ORF type:complete len:300 (+),score=60.40 gb/GECG01002926.1/:1-900(+)
MVSFICGACQETLKKNQVDKHIPKCPQCWVLTCVDCSQDFEGEAFRKHTSCVTEAEKYQGKLYQAKKKKKSPQEQFLEAVASAAADTTIKPQLQKLLKQLGDFPNVPRKQKKFVNFCKNSFQVKDGKLMEELWDVIQSHSQASQPESSTSGSATSTEATADGATTSASTSAASSDVKNDSKTSTTQSNGHTEVNVGGKRQRAEATQENGQSRPSKQSKTEDTIPKKQWKKTIVDLLEKDDKAKTKGLKEKKLLQKARSAAGLKSTASSVTDSNFQKALEKLESKSKIQRKKNRITLASE